MATGQLTSSRGGATFLEIQRSLMAALNYD
jgi:hypothetical protein